MVRQKVLVVANTSWYLYNFRLPVMLEMLAGGLDVVAVAPRDSFSARLEDHGIRLLDLMMNRRGLNPLMDSATFFQLLGIYRREEPRYVFHNTIKPVIYGSIAARYADIPVVLNMIPGLGYIFGGEGTLRKTLRSLVRAQYRFALAGSHTVFFQNRDDRNYFIRYELVKAARTVLTNGSGVDLDRFSFVEKRHDAGTCTFLFLGRLLRDKGIVEFFEAAGGVRNRFPHARFQVLGALDDGNPSRITREELEGWTRLGVVEYLGAATDVRPALQNADVVVLPSYREGVPKSLLEAMAVGRPIITTDVPGCRETVEPGINGLLVPPKDISALRDAMMTLVSDPRRREVMGREGRRFAEQKFDVRAVNALILRSMDLSNNPTAPRS